MKAIVLREFGGPEVLRLEEVPTPTPGPGEVLVRVKSVSVNRTLDLQVRQDGGGYGVTLPMVLGVDPSGVVEVVGPEVEQPGVGDRVTGILTIQQACGYAEYAVVPASQAYVIPEPLSFGEATVVSRHFPMDFSLANVAGLQKDEWVLIMGAAGALGSCGIQVAKHIGARVIAAAGSDQRVDAACSLGADFGVNYHRDDLEQAVMRISQGHGADVVFENIGDPTLWLGAFRSLAVNGRLVTVGAHGGGQVDLDVKRLYSRHLRIMSGMGGIRPGDVERSLELTATGRFRVLIDRTMPLSQAAEAHRLVSENGLLGKVILDPTL